MRHVRSLGFVVGGEGVDVGWIHCLTGAVVVRDDGAVANVRK